MNSCKEQNTPKTSEWDKRLLECIASSKSSLHQKMQLAFNYWHLKDRIRICQKLLKWDKRICIKISLSMEVCLWEPRSCNPARNLERFMENEDNYIHSKIMEKFENAKHQLTDVRT